MSLYNIQFSVNTGTGTTCPNFCPIDCGPHDMKCCSGKDENGCKGEDFCAPIYNGKSVKSCNTRVKKILE